MSKRCFFNVPKSILPFIDSDTIPQKLYNENWICPTLVDKFMFNFEMWKDTSDTDLTYFETEADKYKAIVNANWLAKNYIHDLLTNTYSCEWESVSVGGEMGVNINAYYSGKDDCYYIYTVNIYKRTHAIKETGKQYLICIYKINRRMFWNIYGNQNKYEFYIRQFPTGIKFDFLNKTEKSVFQQEVNDNWDFGTNIRSDAWPFGKAWWKRNNN